MGTALVVTAVAVTGATSATAAAAAPALPNAPVGPNALAAQSAAALVASRPAYLQASAGDKFIQNAVVSSGGMQYVPYQRTYGELPVVGGDFVLVTNSAGQVVFNSVAMQHPIGTLATTPSVTKAAAEAIATKQLTTVTKVEGTQLVVNALGAAPRLAWESTVDGFGADGISRLTVDTDALTGAVLRTQEHVAHGTGTAAWNG